MSNAFDNAYHVVYNNKPVKSITTNGNIIYDAPYIEIDMNYNKTLTRSTYSRGFVGNNITIDYGDGTIISGTGYNMDYTHTYSTQNQTVKIYGATGLNNHCFYNINAYGIKIPFSVTTINTNAFYNTTLHYIILPKTITSIGDNVFRACNSIEEITFSWTTSDSIITYNSNWLTSVSSSRNYKFKIPPGTKALYIAKGYPSDRLDDGTVISSVNLNATKTTLSKSHNDTTTLTATVIDDNNQSVSGEIVQLYNGNTLIGTMTESNGTYSYTYTSQGSGDLSLSAKCSGVSSSPIPIQDYLLVPPLNGTDAITKWTNGTNNTSNGIFTSHGSFLTNDWSNDGLWQLDFDYKYTNTRYIGVLFLCNNVNITSDSLMSANAWGVWEGGFPPTWGSLSIISSPSSFSKPSQTSWNHITIQKISSNQVKLILNNNYEWVYQLNNLPNWSSLHFGSKNNPSSPNTGGNIQFQNIVVKPL